MDTVETSETAVCISLVVRPDSPIQKSEDLLNLNPECRGWKDRVVVHSNLWECLLGHHFYSA